MLGGFQVLYLTMLAGKAAICIGEMQVNLDNLYVCGTVFSSKKLPLR